MTGRRRGKWEDEIRDDTEPSTGTRRGSTRNPERGILLISVSKGDPTARSAAAQLVSRVALTAPLQGADK
jgi:hypothetical protein